MKAVCWNAKHDIRVEDVADPTIINARDAVIKITRTAICGSDLHLYNGYVPTMQSGDILGHEFMGEVVELGNAVTNLKVGDKVIVPFTISCGQCWHCSNKLYSACNNSNPNAMVAEKEYGFAPAGVFGYSHSYGGYAGGQAQYARVPYADVGPLKIPEGIPDDKVLFLTDIFPTGYQAAYNCNITGGDTIAIWGCGPVGQFAIRSAFMLGAEKVIAIDRYEERLQLARDAGAEAINFEEVDNVVTAVMEMSGGRGPDACIDAVGLEALGHGFGAVLDWSKQLARMQTDRPNVLRQAIQACRKGGIVSIPGVYGGIVDGLNFGSAFNKGLTFKMGQTHVQAWTDELLQRVMNGDIDPSFVISHVLPIDDAPRAYEIFKKKQNGCTKVVLDPWAYMA